MHQPQLLVLGAGLSECENKKQPQQQRKQRVGQKPCAFAPGCKLRGSSGVDQSRSGKQATHSSAQNLCIGSLAHDRAAEGVRKPLQSRELLWPAKENNLWTCAPREDAASQSESSRRREQAQEGQLMRPAEQSILSSASGRVDALGMEWHENARQSQRKQSLQPANHNSCHSDTEGEGETDATAQGEQLCRRYETQHENLSQNVAQNPWILGQGGDADTKGPEVPSDVQSEARQLLASWLNHTEEAASIERQASGRSNWPESRRPRIEIPSSFTSLESKASASSKKTRRNTFTAVENQLQELRGAAEGTSSSLLRDDVDVALNVIAERRREAAVAALAKSAAQRPVTRGGGLPSGSDPLLRMQARQQSIRERRDARIRGRSADASVGSAGSGSDDVDSAADQRFAPSGLPVHRSRPSHISHTNNSNRSRSHGPADRPTEPSREATQWKTLEGLRLEQERLRKESSWFEEQAAQLREKVQLEAQAVRELRAAEQARTRNCIAASDANQRLRELEREREFASTEKRNAAARRLAMVFDSVCRRAEAVGRRCAFGQLRESTLALQKKGRLAVAAYEAAFLGNVLSSWHSAAALASLERQAMKHLEHVQFERRQFKMAVEHYAKSMLRKNWTVWCLIVRKASYERASNAVNEKAKAFIAAIPEVLRVPAQRATCHGDEDNPQTASQGLLGEASSSSAPMLDVAHAKAQTETTAGPEGLVAQPLNVVPCQNKKRPSVVQAENSCDQGYTTPTEVYQGGSSKGEPNRQKDSRRAGVSRTITGSSNIAKVHDSKLKKSNSASSTARGSSRVTKGNREANKEAEDVDPSREEVIQADTHSRPATSTCSEACVDPAQEVIQADTHSRPATSIGPESCRQAPERSRLVVRMEQRAEDRKKVAESRRERQRQKEEEHKQRQLEEEQARQRSEEERRRAEVQARRERALAEQRIQAEKQVQAARRRDQERQAKEFRVLNLYVRAWCGLRQAMLQAQDLELLALSRRLAHLLWRFLEVWRFATIRSACTRQAACLGRAQLAETWLGRRHFFRTLMAALGQLRDFRRQQLATATRSAQRASLRFGFLGLAEGASISAFEKRSQAIVQCARQLLRWAVPLWRAATKQSQLDEAQELHKQALRAKVSSWLHEFDAAPTLSSLVE